MAKTRVLFILSFLLIWWGGPKMNNTRVLFILFILFILGGNILPCKKGLISQKWLKPGFCSFCLLCWFDGGEKWTKPGFCSVCSFCSFFWGTFPLEERDHFRKMAKTRVLFILSFLLILGGGAKNQQNPGFVNFVHFVHFLGEHSPL